MKIITVINDKDNKYFNLLKLSCALNYHELIVLVSKESDFYSLRLKDKLLNEYLSEEDDNELILFTDGTDTIFLASEDEILEKYEKFGSDLVFSTDLGCWPDKKMAKLFDEDKNSPFIYLNSGGFIGKAGLIKELLNNCDFDDENYSYSNQYVWSKCYLANRDRIKLDTNCEIFCALNSDIGNEFINIDIDIAYEVKKRWFENNFLFESNRLLNKITNSYPCQIHFNGYSRAFLDDRIFDMVYASITDYKATKFYYEE